MSISDDLMWRYFELLSFRASNEIADLKRSTDEGANPRDIKIMLAKELVARFHTQDAADRALDDFLARFQRGAMPDDMPEMSICAGTIAQVLKQACLVASTSEAYRMIDGGGVRVDGDKVSNKALMLEAGKSVVLQVGKRKFARVTLA
jgi:tyrosyl-tRNA synthetase